MGPFHELKDLDKRSRREDYGFVRSADLLKRTAETYRLMTLQELILKYPNAWFNEAGDLILTKSGHKWIVSSMLHCLGKWHPGFHSWMYVRR